MCHSVSGTIPFRRNNSHEKTGAKPSLHHIGRGGRLMSHSRPRRLKRRATRHVPNTAHGNPTTLPLPMPATCHRGVSGRHLTPLLGWTAFWWPQRSGTCPAAAQRTFPPASKVSTVITGEGPASPDDVVNAVGRGCRGGRQELHFPLWLTTARRGLTGKQI
jgi:hypothetical protein